MAHMDKVRKLRNDENVHYNCTQAILVGFSDVLGVSDEEAYNLGKMFGSGMMHGSTCGVISGAFMVLGAAGFDNTKGAEILKNFREKHQYTDCARLLAKSREDGIAKKDHCDGLVYEMTEYLDSIL